MAMIAGHALIFCFEEHFNIIFGFWSYIQVVQHSSLYFYNGLLSYTYAKKIKVTTHECRYAAKYKWVPRRNVYHKKSQLLKTSVLLFGSCRLPLPIIMNFYEVCFFTKMTHLIWLDYTSKKTERYAIKLQHVDRLAFTSSFDAQTCLLQR